MCGISGIVELGGGAVDRALLAHMNDLIEHRGPDGHGILIERNLGLAHRRLAILDLSDEGIQPMEWQDRLVVVFNGEIYNYIELRDELQLLGYAFRTGTDTEIILAAYAHWGDECVNHFNGMWAFALFDRQNRRLFCSRDRFGVKPFHYKVQSGRFQFGSEIKQLLDSSPKVNKRILSEFIQTGIANHTAETFFKGIECLPASHNLIIDLRTGQWNTERYYTIERDEQVNSLDLSGFVARLTDEFSRSVRYRQRSDVKVGSCLSGGLDSSSVVTEASDQLNAQGADLPMTAITAISTEPATDETEFARAVVENSDLVWRTTKPQFEDFVSLVDEVVYTQEEPFGGPSVFMQYAVMAEAKEAGCKVMLDGQGGDETLLGYQKYYPSAYLAFAKSYGWRRALREIQNSSKNNTRMSIKWILLYSAGIFLASPRRWHSQWQTRVMKSHWRNLTDLPHMRRIAYAARDVFELQRLEIECTNLPVLLRFEDRNSMRHSIETRLPFLDYRFLESALSGRVEHKIHGGWVKYALRVMMRGRLPDRIAWRKDNIGFNAPENSWLLAHTAAMKAEIASSELLKDVCHMSQVLGRFESLNSQLKWRLYIIAVWERLYNVER